MTFEERQGLRTAVSAAQKQRWLDWCDTHGVLLCAGCGTPRENTTIGCVACWDRMRRRRRRESDPGLRAREAADRRAARRRREERPFVGETVKRRRAA